MIAVDRDENVVRSNHYKELMKTFGPQRLSLVHGRFSDLSTLVRSSPLFQNKDNNNNSIAGVLFDLGMSSMQIDSKTRGFSYKESHDAPLGY